MSKLKNQKMKKIDHNQLKRIRALTTSYAEVLSEAATRSLAHNSHSIPVVIKSEGIISGDIEFVWEKLTNTISLCYNDLQDATELGAYGISILLVETFMKYRVISKSKKGTGFDYWLGIKGDKLFQNKARLEVSGILKGTANEIETRRKQKIKQTQVSKGKLPAIVIIVEFGKPTAVVCDDK